MRESDSNMSSHGFSTEINVPDPDPYQHPQTLVQRYFVPIMLSMVVAIVSVSTFRHNDAVFQVASNSPDQDGSSDPGGTTTVSNRTIANLPSDRAGTVVESVAVETDSGAYSANTNVAHSPALPGNRGPGNTYPQIPPPAYARPVMHPPASVDLLEQQRKTYHEAMQARQQHWARIRAYRASIQKRLQQDREAMYRRMQEIEQRARQREDRRFNRMEPTEKLAGYYAT